MASAWDAQGRPVNPNSVIGWDAEGRPVRRRDAGRPLPTPASRAIPDRQSNVVAAPTGGNIFQQVSRAVTGEGQRQPGVGEIAYQQVPIETPAQIDKPETWLDDFGRSAAIGLGFFLNPNERARAEIIRRQVPTAEFRRDEYNNLQVRYRPDRPWAYINRPGASPEDAQTFASETGKYIAVSRAPGLRSPAAEGLIAGTVRAGVTGAATSTAGQAASMPLGASEVNLGDVAVSGAGAAAGNVIGSAIVGAARAAPQVSRTVARVASDVFPGGAQRAAERTAAQTAMAEQARAASEQVARNHAESMVRANAQQMNLAGEALEAAVRDAQEKASATVAQQWATNARPSDVDKLARGFGVQLARSQAKGDAEGMRFMYEAAGGLHGPSAQRSAAAFLEAQNRALPEGIRAIAGDASISSPQAGVNVARTAMERAQASAREAERSAWDAFDSAVPAGRTYDVTPRGNAGAVQTVQRRIRQQLVADKKLMMVESGVDEAGNALPPRPVMPPEFEASFPRVSRVLSLMDRMATAPKAQMPLRDVDRIIQLKRFIDAQWEEAGTQAEKRILTMMGTTVRDWLKETTGAGANTAAGRSATNLAARGAKVTSSALQNALEISSQNAKRFRESQIIQDMLDPRTGMTDDEVTRRIFGGGQGGLNVSSDGLQALQAIKETLGPSHPAWEAVRQAALQRLTRGLDDAIPTNQTPAILTTFKRIEEAFRANREAMEVLFSPSELARLRQAQRVVAAMAPTPRNPVNPSGSGIVTGRAINNALKIVGDMLKQVPGANIAAGAAADVTSSARVAAETAGVRQTSQASDEIAQAIREFWYGKPTRISGVGSAVGTDQANDPPNGRR